MEVLLIISQEFQVFLEPSPLTPADRAAVTIRLTKMHATFVMLAQVNVNLPHRCHEEAATGGEGSGSEMFCKTSSKQDRNGINFCGWTESSARMVSVF